MAKRKTTRKTAAKKTAPRKRTPKVDSADGDFMEVGKEVVPGMRLRCICRGHTGTIGRIAWSPCGRFIASPSMDQTIRIWDANDGKCLAVLKGHGFGGIFRKRLILKEIRTAGWTILSISSRLRGIWLI